MPRRKSITVASAIEENLSTAEAVEESPVAEIVEESSVAERKVAKRRTRKKEPNITVNHDLRCINCGYTAGVLVDEKGNRQCPSCKHRWTTEEEKAPFVKMMR